MDGIDLFNLSDEEAQTIIEPNNPLLGEVLEKYECEDLLPLAQRIIWLSSLKEALGKIPDEIEVDYMEMRLLVVLMEEQNKKMMYENYKMKQESRRNLSSIDIDMNTGQ